MPIMIGADLGNCERKKNSLSINVFKNKNVEISFKKSGMKFSSEKKKQTNKWVNFNGDFNVGNFFWPGHGVAGTWGTVAVQMCCP